MLSSLVVFVTLDVNGASYKINMPRYDQRAINKVPMLNPGNKVGDKIKIIFTIKMGGLKFCSPFQ